MKIKENAPFLELKERQEMFAHIELVGTDVLVVPDVPPVKSDAGIFFTDKALEEATRNSFKSGAMVLAVGPDDTYLPKNVVGKRVKLVPNSSDAIKHQEQGKYGYHALVVPSHLIAVILNNELRPKEGEKK